ncbi:hypothetical protein BH09SUM1_BH09SUM1_10540 [soil metagenome]
MAEVQSSQTNHSRFVARAALWSSCAAAACIACYYYQFSRHTDLSGDEFQMMAVANELLYGKQLYVDVWDNHGAFASYLLKAAMGVLNLENEQFILTLRTLMWMILTITAGCVGWAAKLATGRAWLAGLAVVIFFSASPVAHTGYEIRSDVPAHLLWAGVLLLWMQGWKSGRLLWFFAAGCAMGFIFGFSIKALLLGVAAGAMFLTAFCYRPWKDVARWMLSFGAGSAVGPIVIALYLQSNGLLHAYLETNIGQNFDRARPSVDDAYREIQRFDPQSFWVFCVICAWMIFQIVRKRVPGAVVAMFAALMTVAAEYAFLLPRHFMQSLLPLVGPVAVCAAWAMGDLVETASRNLPQNRFVQLIPFAPIWCLLYFQSAHAVARVDYRGTIRTHLKIQKSQTKAIPLDEFVYSGRPSPVNRRKPFRYVALVETIRDRIMSGQIKFDIAAELDRLDVRYVTFDDRMGAMAEGSIPFIFHNYFPLKAKSTVAAGQALDPNDGGTTATIRIAGLYYWAMENDTTTTLKIDGAAAANPAEIADGAHRFEWPGSEPMWISVAPPKKWGALDQRRAFLAFDGDSISYSTYTDWW